MAKVLEEIRSEVKTVSEQHGSIMQKLEEHDKRFEKIDEKLGQHDLQFLKIEQKLLEFDKKFDQIEKVISTVISDHETRIKNVEEKVVSI